MDMDKSNRATGTPKTAQRRLPRSLSGTKAAEERKKLCQKLRQRRKRAREKVEAKRRLQLNTSSDEEPEQDYPGDPVQLEDGEDSDGNEQRQRHFRGMEAEEERIVALRPTETVLVQANCRLSEEATIPAGAAAAATAAAREIGDTVEEVPAPTCLDKTTEEIKKLAKEFALVKCSSYVSDAAMDKLFRMFVANHEVIMKLVLNGVVAGNYTKGIRPLITGQILPIYSSILLKIMDERGPRYKVVKNLKSIPAEYLNLPDNGPTKLLRIDTYTRLKDVKENYLATHGRTAETLQNLRNCAVSADGVAESKMGSRTFVVVTVRFGFCLYPVRIFNPLIGVEESKPSAKEILRYFTCNRPVLIFLKLIIITTATS